MPPKHSATAVRLVWDSNGNIFYSNIVLLIMNREAHVREPHKQHHVSAIRGGGGALDPKEI